MFGWLKKIFGWKKEEKAEKTLPASEPTMAVNHFHVDRHTETKTNHLPDNIDEMSKLDFDIWARVTHGINLDRRKTKNNMIVELKKKLGEKD